jgi:hypothetical protein
VTEAMAKPRASRAAAALVLAVISKALWVHEEEYTLSTEVEAPLDKLYSLLTNVSEIAVVHPHLAGITSVISEEHHPAGSIVEWTLETSAMWAPPWPLGFLKRLKTQEHVSTVATLAPGVRARIQNVGLKGNRGKLVPFYYLHYWDLEAISPTRTRLTDYELLKGSAIKFWLGATKTTVVAHTDMQANIRAWAYGQRQE